MRKKLCIRRIFALTFLLFLFSCRNEDLSNAAAKNMREEEFFREALSKTARVKNGNNIVEALKAQNEKSHFIAAMKDQRGLPVWGKMKPLYTTSSQNKSGDVEEVYSVPLIMNGWITSVLYVGMKDNNVQNLRSITNTDLWDIINNETVDKKMRESLLLNCLLYDAEIFGTDVFIKIPTSLLGAEAGKNSVRSVGQSEESGETNSLFAVCISWTSNCTCGGGSCDHCNEDGQCVSNYECIGGGGGIPNGEGDSNGHGTPGDTGSGGGGGNQGGSGGDEGDDCSLDNKPFYKIVPCDDDDGGDNHGGIIDPCAKGKTVMNTMTSIKNSSLVEPKLDQLFNYANNSNVEYGLNVANVSGTLKASDPFTSNSPGSVTIPAPTTGDYVANAHSHPSTGAAVPSPADIYNALGNAVKYNTFTGIYIFSTNGNVYSIAVNNRETATAFLASFPASTNLTNGGKEFTNVSEFGQKYNDILDCFSRGKCPTYSGNGQNDGMESATAWILNQYNSGMSIAKMDANGVFKTLNPKSFDYVIPASGGQHTTAYKTENCP